MTLRPRWRPARPFVGNRTAMRGSALSAGNGFGWSPAGILYLPGRPGQSLTGSGWLIIFRSIWIWRLCSQVFRRTTPCARRWAPAADCVCCARTPGNASRPSFFPQPSRLFKSGKSLRCCANAMGTAFRFRRDTRRPSPFPRPLNWRRATEAALRNCKMGFRAPQSPGNRAHHRGRTTRFVAVGGIAFERRAR